MKGDFSRWTFDPANHFTRVLMQQGRVQLDADWNEQVSILLHYMQTLAQDMMGPHGTPNQTDFQITAPSGEAPKVSKGCYYVEGIRCENETEQSLEVTEGGSHLVYLDAWERHVTHTEHDDPQEDKTPGIREVALRGADTTTRTQVVWQVRVDDITITTSLKEKQDEYATLKAELETPYDYDWPEQITQFKNLVDKLNEVINTFDEDENEGEEPPADLSAPNSENQVYLKKDIDPIITILREMQSLVEPLNASGTTPSVAQRIDTLNNVVNMFDKEWDNNTGSFIEDSNNADGLKFDAKKQLPDMGVDPKDFYLKSDIKPFLDAVRNVITALQTLEQLPTEVTLDNVTTEPYSDADAALTRMVKEHHLQQLEKEIRDANIAIQEAMETHLAAAQSTATLQAQTSTGTDQTTDDPCTISPEAQYRGPENQLYRVEIHDGGDESTITFKWSRENGSVVFPIRKLTGKTVTVAHLGQDDTLGLRKGDWVEIVADDTVLAGEAGPLAEVEAVKAAELTVTLKAAVEVEYDENSDKHPLLRRWDQESDAIAVTEGTWQDLEYGIQIKFSSGGSYRSGDYWLIPARTETGGIEWPKENNGNPKAMPSLGVKHHYAPLAILTSDNGTLSAIDCRRIFQPLWQPAGV